MAAFFEQLWESIFTPGPTPTLLVATNASFAALQVLLFVMLLATYSIHFVILSILCGGLWWSINWFATEIRAAQAKEEEAKRIREARRSAKGKGDDGDGEAMDSGDDTEVDTEVEQKQAPKSKPTPSQPRAARPEAQSTVFVERPEGSSARSTPQPSAATAGSQGPATTTTTTTTPAAASTTGTTTGLAVPADETVKRRKGMAESVGDLSTDSEWDKLSEDSEDR